MSTVQVQSKVLKSGLTTIIVTLNGQEGMTFPEVVRVLGIPRKTISDYCEKVRVELWRIPAGIASTLRKDNVIPLRGATPLFIPKSTIKDLVRYYSTPATDLIYQELWEAAEGLHSIKEMDVGLDKPSPVSTSVVRADGSVDMDALKVMVNSTSRALDELTARVDKAEQRLIHQEMNAVTYAVEFGITSAQIIQRYPAYVMPFILKGKALCYKSSMFTPNDRTYLTMGLKASGVTSIVRKTQGPFDVQLFDLAAVEKAFGINRPNSGK